MRKFVLDTNLYIDAFRKPEDAEPFQRNYYALLPWIHMSSVVVQELLAGAESPRRALSLDRHLVRLFERTRRIVTPSHEAWKRSGEILAELARREGLDLRRVPKSFVNDVLLAASCRESGLTLITANLDDFSRIRRAIPFHFVPPWPAGPA